MTVRNVLFVMCDQLRADYLSCYGARVPLTPNIDALAARGTRFDRAYVAAPVCAPSRMSFYTGRYTLSHGATWNSTPLPVGEATLGAWLRPHGVRTAVVGKTHHIPDGPGMQRLGISPVTPEGALVAEGGFEPFARDDGIHPDGRVMRHAPYNAWLRERGYGGQNPWHEYANAAIDERGGLASGWLMRNAHRPARIPDELSESAWTVDKAIEFINTQGEAPWCLHVSFIKPHWPYIVSSPYHDMYGDGDIPAPVRSEAEHDDANPIFAGFREHPESLAFSRDEVRRNVVPAYMGLVRQMDAHFGRLLAHLDRTGRAQDTLVIFTSDHGDFLGDHWLGEKEMMYEQGVRVPFIVVDPSLSGERTRISDALVEAVDVVPTCLDALDLPIPTHVLEGRTLLPLLAGGNAWTRDAAFSELDYAVYPTGKNLGLRSREARMVMVRTDRWKFTYFGRQFPAQLFDLREDPFELHDLARDPARVAVIGEMQARMFEWMRDRRNRVAQTDDAVEAQGDRMGATGLQFKIGDW